MEKTLEELKKANEELKLLFTDSNGCSVVCWIPECLESEENYIIAIAKEMKIFWGDSFKIKTLDLLEKIEELKSKAKPKNIHRPESEISLDRAWNAYENDPYN